MKCEDPLLEYFVFFDDEMSFFEWYICGECLWGYKFVTRA